MFPYAGEMMWGCLVRWTRQEKCFNLKMNVYSPANRGNYLPMDTAGHSLLYNGYRVFPWGRKRPERDADPSPPSKDEV
jgi:hypothetical protein